MKGTQSQFIKKWLPIEKSLCPPFIVQKLGEKVIEESLIASIQENWRFCLDEKNAEKGYDYCRIKGAKISDYLYRQLTTPFGEVVTSIRFIGGDLTKPAVFLMHKDFDLKKTTEIAELGAFLKHEYAVFKPKRFRWFSTQDESSLIAENEGIEGDMIYCTGFISALQNTPKPAKFNSIQLQEATSLDWYERYFNSYQDMYRANPFFKEMASVESRESLQQMIESSLLFEIIIEGKWAGIIGVCAAEHKFLKGYEVYEEYLLAEFRGKHFAPAVQRHLIECLPSNENKMLYGTIHYQNQPSIKTAKRVGRKVAGMYVFADI